MHPTHIHESLHLRLRWVAGQAGLVTLGILIYFGVRGLTESSADVAVARARRIVDFERLLGIDVESSLQAPVRASHVVETMANWTYIWGHWPVIIVTMLWLAWHHRPVFLRLRDAMMVSGGLGMLIFVSYPVAPPRLAGLGMIDTVTEKSQAYRILQPPAFVNQYAALPSLHAGWDLLVGIAIVTASTSLVLRIVGFAMPVLMCLAVLMTANHYVVDVVAGIALVLVGHAVALHLEQRRTRRAAGP